MEENLKKKLTTSLIVFTILYLLAICIALIVKINMDSCKINDVRSDYKEKIQKLKLKSDSLSNKVVEYEQKIKERDKKLSFLFSKVKDDDRLFRNFKTNSDAKIQYLNSISPDSLYMFLSGVRFYPGK